MAAPSPPARLARLLTPNFADEYALWSARPEGGAERLAGSATGEPPTTTPGGAGLWGRDERGAWGPCSAGSIPRGRHCLAIPVPEADMWLIVERSHDRPAFDGEEIGWLREAAGLAGQAFESARLSERLLEARASADGAAHRWATIVRVSRELARSVDLEETIEAVLHSIVPYLADCVILDVLDPRGAPRRSVRHLSRESSDASLTLDRFPFGETPLPDAIAALPDGGMVVGCCSEEAWDDLVPSADRHEVERLDPCSLAVVPVPIGEGPGGALTLVAAGSGQHYDATDLDLFRQIALQVGLALTTAITFAEVRSARREREEVLAIVSHDLKNPLNALRFAAALLRMPDLPEERKRQQIPGIERAVDQMDALIDSLLDASRIDAGRFSVAPEPIAPEIVAREAVDQMRPLAQGERVEIALELEPGLPWIAADRERVLRVFGNLLSNAISFSPPGRDVRVRALAVPGGVRFEVQDRGPGMEPEALERIFDRFWQARRQGRAGAGLGLTIARGIVLAHGGSIDVDSEVGVGTTFRFTIPLAESPAGRSSELETHSGRKENHDA